MKEFWKQLPVGVKFVAVAIISVLVTVGLVEPEVLNFTNFIQNQSPETIQVEFNIYSKDTNDPIERAEVQFIFDGAPEPRLTNSDGYVRIEIPDRDDVDVIIKKEGFLDLNRTINLNADEGRTVIYFLETDENYSSYNLYGDGFDIGFSFNGSKSQTINASFLDGSFSSPSENSPFIKTEFDISVNEDVRYEIVDSDNGVPLEILEKVNGSNISLFGTLEVLYNSNDKLYKYSDSLSENGILIGKEIVHKNADDLWIKNLAGEQADETEKIELSMHSNWDGIFLNYPKSPIKLGNSWDLTQYLIATDAITEGTATATFSEITEYEGEPAALISIEGSWSKKGNGNEEDDSFIDSLIQRLTASLLKKMGEEYAEVYVLSDLKNLVVEDLYYGDFSLSEDMAEDLYETLIRIYQDADNNPNLQYYGLPEIERYVDDKFIEYSVLDLTLNIIGNVVDANTSSENGDENDSEDLTEGTISGKVYRSLQYPIDLYQEITFSGNTLGNSTPGKYEGKFINKFSK